jgi:hypothetical protein
MTARHSDAVNLLQILVNLVELGLPEDWPKLSNSSKTNSRLQCPSQHRETPHVQRVLF